MGDFQFHASRESHVEDEVIAWATNNGWEVRLMSYRGRRACADTFFFGFGKILPIEFKKIGGSLSGNQVREHERLARVGVDVPVFCTAAAAIEYLKEPMY